VQTARHHDAHPLSRLQTVPGVGQLFSLGRLDASHALQRFPRGQDGVSSCRRVTCAKASAGHRYGPAGTKSGPASLTGAFSEAVVLLLRHQAPGQQSLARVETTHGPGQALPILAPQVARAVSSR
jgi:hypothetical protein